VKKALFFAALLAAADARAQGTVSFERDILPIFEASCVDCHGAEIQESGLRLDSEAAVVAGGILGPSSGESTLIRRLLGVDEPAMPFGAEPLSAAEIALIKRWIDERPKERSEPAHWAYRKPVRPDLPNVSNPDWVRNSIDAFVLARLDREGLSPSPEAPRATLLRRLSLDLIGLPPTLEELDRFLEDGSPGAYERAVDRLLASPRYGERWARPWLDLARFADTNGYEKDGPRSIWKYRDWVIDAINRDLPFRDFTIEQIAGDMLEDAGVEPRIATGFHRNTLLNQEGGVDDEEARFETLLDRVNTTATVWLGTTLACAQCHNHKFDPFTQKDYYRFLAFFDHSAYEILKLGQGESWVVEPELPLPTPEQKEEADVLEAEIDALRARLEIKTPELEADRARWEEAMRKTDGAWTVLRPRSYESKGGATLRLLEDGSILASGKNPESDTYVVRVDGTRGRVTAVRLEVFPDPSLPRGGPGRDPDGTFFLSGFRVEGIAFEEAIADDFQPGYEIARVLSEVPGAGGWSIDVPEAPFVRQAVFVPEEPFELDFDLVIHLEHEIRLASKNVGRFRISVTSVEDPERLVEIPARLRPLLDVPEAKRTAEDVAALERVHRSVTPLLDPVRERIEELEEKLAALAIPTTLVLEERASHERPSTPLRLRGSFLSPGERVYADVPAALPPLPESEMPNRLGLARWLVDEDNPLAARVTVNRFWEKLFGRGLVETSEDFGTQGSPPTHPELLDWLATELVANGWSTKALLRTIATSATYRQSSAAATDDWERDPANHLLARGPRFRVEAEMVRDLFLAASGLLTRTVGGPSVFPYQPDGIWDRPYSDERWVMSDFENRTRRGLYTYVRRTAPYPSGLTFDAPSREVCTARRPRTNTPLQALTTLNDPAFFEAAQHLGRLLLTAPDPVSNGFRRVVSREPTPEERRHVETYFESERARFANDLPAALAVVEEQWEEGLDLPRLAAWTMVANVLLNLDETITKE
jgi:hypothetical protein